MATSLKHAQESMNGENKVAQQLESSFTSEAFTPPTTVPELKYVVFKLVKKGIRRTSVDGICHNVLNITTGKHETIRLIRGAHSIWTTELTEILKDKEYVSKNRISLYFIDGICRVPVHDQLTLEYARKNLNNVGKNRTGSGKRDYYEYDAAEEQKMRYDKQLQRIYTIQTISNMPEHKMIKLALFLGIKPYDEDTSLPKIPQGYRTELLLKADTQQEIVNKYIDSTEVEVSYLVRKAIMDAKIDLTGQNGNALWAGGNGFICKIPQNRKSVEYLTELAMTNSNEGKSFKEQLETRIT